MKPQRLGVPTEFPQHGESKRSLVLQRSTTPRRSVFTIKSGGGFLENPCKLWVKLGKILVNHGINSDKPDKPPLKFCRIKIFHEEWATLMFFSYENWTWNGYKVCRKICRCGKIAMQITAVQAVHFMYISLYAHRRASGRNRRGTVYIYICIHCTIQDTWQYTPFKPHAGKVTLTEEDASELQKGWSKNKIYIYIYT